MGITDTVQNLFPNNDNETNGSKKLGRKTKEKTTEPNLTRFLKLEQDIPNEELRKAYKYESCTNKAINKKSNDCFEKWFKITDDDGEKLDDNPTQVVQNLIERTDARREFVRMVKQSQIFGGGYIEIIYANDNDTSVSEAPDGDQIENLVLIDSDTITPFVDSEVGSETRGEIIKYIQKIDGDKIEIHKDRVIHFPWQRVGTNERGVSAIQPIYNVVKSKVLLDQLVGDIPESVVNQIISLNIEGANDDELDQAMEDLEEVQNAYRFAGSEKHTFDVHDAGTGLDIKPFTEHVVQQLATGLGIPKTIMLGAGAGEISTAQVNLKDYYSDIRNIQRRFETVIREIVDKEFELQGVDQDYEIDWNELYTEDEKESEIMFNKARAANQLSNPTPILSPDEIREMFFNLEPREKDTENDEGVGDDYV